jgi:dTDP-4-amino-4,6-dideoxygalactose transaminase
MKVPFFAGSNFRMNEILSAILNVQLGRLEGILEALRREKRMIAGELERESAFRLNPVNDAEGDCATTVALLLDSPEEARALAERLGKEHVGVMLPIETGRHVYSNWEPVMKKRGAHHPGRDAFRLAEEEYAYAEDMCPRTLSILERTVCISTDPTRPEEETKRLIETVRKAAGG